MKVGKHKKDQQYDQPSPLMLKTVELLKGRDLQVVFVETGIGIYWLRKFRGLEIPNPSVNRVQHLYEYLTGSSLSIQ